MRLNSFLKILRILGHRPFSVTCGWHLRRFTWKKILANSDKGFDGGAQNCGQYKEGAYTGEISPVALADMGATFVIVGHSERRQHYGENGDVLKDKILAAIESGLEVVFCVGEDLSEREQGRTQEVVTAQLKEALADFPLEQQDKLIVAYEPVWAIGTGQTATPVQADKVHRLIRRILSSLKIDGERISLLYGGSVRPENIEELLVQENIDGALVGGASLNGASFARMGDAFLGSHKTH